MNGKKIVITGASEGIGAETAKLLSAKGATVVLVARRREALEQVAAQCPSPTQVIVADVTRRAEVERVVAEALAQQGHLDAWVNNVGRGISRPVSALTDEDVDEMVQLNVKTALYGMQSVLPHFKARGTGHLVNISSMLGRVPFASVRAAYSGAKAMVNALTANLRMELRETNPGIQVSLVSPGPVATSFGTNARHGGLDSRVIPGAQDPAEVARVIVEVLTTRRADAYTRPAMHAQVAAYYAAEDLGAYEAQNLSGPRR